MCPTAKWAAECTGSILKVSTWAAAEMLKRTGPITMNQNLFTIVLLINKVETAVP
jgi:hypothetical protein